MFGREWPSFPIEIQPQEVSDISSTKQKWSVWKNWRMFLYNTESKFTNDNEITKNT